MFCRPYRPCIGWTLTLLPRLFSACTVDAGGAITQQRRPCSAVDRQQSFGKRGGVGGIGHASSHLLAPPRPARCNVIDAVPPAISSRCSLPIPTATAAVAWIANTHIFSPSRTAHVCKYSSCARHSYQLRLELRMAWSLAYTLPGKKSMPEHAHLGPDQLSPVC